MRVHIFRYNNCLSYLLEPTTTMRDEDIFNDPAKCGSLLKLGRYSLDHNHQYGRNSSRWTNSLSVVLKPASLPFILILVPTIKMSAPNSSNSSDWNRLVCGLSNSLNIKHRYYSMFLNLVYRNQLCTYYVTLHGINNKPREKLEQAVGSKDSRPPTGFIPVGARSMKEVTAEHWPPDPLPPLSGCRIFQRRERAAPAVASWAGTKSAGRYAADPRHGLRELPPRMPPCGPAHQIFRTRSPLTKPDDKIKLKIIIRKFDPDDEKF